MLNMRAKLISNSLLRPTRNTRSSLAVLNIPFLSKLLERAVQRRLQQRDSLDAVRVPPVLQRLQSLNYMYIRRLLAADKGQMSAIDLTAFDTVDHELLFSSVQ